MNHNDGTGNIEIDQCSALRSFQKSGGVSDRTQRMSFSFLGATMEVYPQASETPKGGRTHISPEAFLGQAVQS